MQSNLAVARTAAPYAKIWAVVKANAYGHGLEQGLRGFAHADGLSLLEIDAAVRLREAGWQKPVLLIEGLFEPADLAVADAHRLQIVVHNDEQIAMLRSARVNAPLDIYLKINTGMNRLGFVPSKVNAVYNSLRAMPAVGKISFMTHFANAEKNHSVLEAGAQAARFRSAVEGLAGDISLSNSAASLVHRDLAADWIRPGVMLYGGTPGGGNAADFGLKPAMTLQSELIGVQSLECGDVVGYGSLFTAEKSMRVGVVACGYADGYPRHAPTGTPVLVNGVRTRIVGRVSMDMMSVDLAPVPDAGVGSIVTLWGDGLDIDEVAEAAGTIGYELMCAVAPRVQKKVRD